MCAELESHLSDEYRTFTCLLEPMLRAGGVELREAAYDPEGLYAAYVCVLARARALGNDRHEDLADV